MSTPLPDSVDRVERLFDRLTPASDRTTVVFVLAMVTALVEAVTFGRVVAGAARPPMTPDAAVFQHAGWYLTEGGALYLDVWEPKLPLSYETTAVLSLATGGDPTRLHLASVALMMTVTVGVVVLVGLLAHRLTHDLSASLVAGLSLFVLPGFAVRPVYGYKAKYLLLFAGLLCLYLALQELPAAAGVAGAAAVGYWQLGLVFPLVALGLFARDRRRLARLVAGGAVLTLVMLLPVLATDGLAAMVVQTLVVPLSIPETTPLAHRLYAGVVHFRWGTPLVLAGVAGLAMLARETPRTDWWALVPAAWFGVVVFTMDFEVGGYTDLVPGLAFVALGVGVFVDRVRRWRLRRATRLALAGVVLVNVVALGSVGLLFPPVDTPAPEPMSDLAVTDDGSVQESPYPPADTPSVKYVYWNQVRPESCHYRWSGMELDWLAHTDGRDACRSGDAGAILDAWLPSWPSG